MRISEVCLHFLIIKLLLTYQLMHTLCMPILIANINTHKHTHARAYKHTHTHACTHAHTYCKYIHVLLVLGKIYSKGDIHIVYVYMCSMAKSGLVCFICRKLWTLGGHFVAVLPRCSIPLHCAAHCTRL